MKKILLLLLLPTLLLARSRTRFHHEHTHDLQYVPWFTGSLLAPGSTNPEPKHPSIEFFLGIFYTYGTYNSDWKLKTNESILGINPFVDYQAAISKKMGFEILASHITNYKNGMRSSHFQDTFFSLGYQVLDDEKDTWIPDLRIKFETLFPTGNHHNLDPILEGIDATGQGAYFFGGNLSASKLFYLHRGFLSLRSAFTYFVPTRTKIRGQNAYGGGKGTDGKIDPGHFLNFFISGEYSFSQRWVFAFDTLFFHQWGTSNFKGNPGVAPSGLPAPIGHRASTQFSVAPAIEYNIKEGTGLIFGSWLSLAGRNDDAFASFIAAFLYTF